VSGHWQIEIHQEVNGREQLIARKEGVMDPFEELIQAPLNSPYRGQARVSGMYGTQYDFGRLKASFTISVACDQNAATIEKAAEKILYKAIDLTEDAMKMLVEADRKNNPAP
jgi:hypothetical protein